MINKKHFYFLLAITFSLRFLSSWLVKDFKPTLWEYEVLTQNMLERGEYVFDYREYGEYKAILAPGFSVLTYCIYSLFGTSHVIMLFIQYMLMFAAVVAVYKITVELLENENYALCAGLMVALHPGYIHYSSNMLHQLTLYLPLFYWTIFFLIRAFKTNSSKYFMLAGLAGGGAMLTRATIMPVIVLSLIIILILKRNELKVTLKNVALGGTLLAIVYSPWVIRNYIVFDKFVFAQTNKWESFWVGNNPNSTGGHYRVDGVAILNTKPSEMQKEIDESGSELLDNEIFKKYAMDFVENNPGEFVKGLFKKAFYFSWFGPHTGIKYPSKLVIFAKILYAVFLLMTLCGVYYCYKNKLVNKAFIFPILLLLGVSSVHILYFFEMRHRWTVEPVMMIFASIIPVLFFEKMKQKFSTKPSAGEGS